MPLSKANCFPPVPNDDFYPVPFTRDEEGAPVVRGEKGRKGRGTAYIQALSYPDVGRKKIKCTGTTGIIST